MCLYIQVLNIYTCRCVCNSQCYVTNKYIWNSKIKPRKVHAYSKKPQMWKNNSYMCVYSNWKKNHTSTLLQQALC